MSQAKLNGLNGPGQPAMDDMGVLQSFIDEYDMTVKISTAWSSLLNEDEAMLLESNVGTCQSEQILHTGKQLAATVLKLCWQYCNQREVGGAKSLYNPSTRLAYTLPCYDQDDFLWVPFCKNLSITANHYDKKPNFDVFILEEAADACKIQILRAEQLTRHGGTTCLMLCHMQRTYDWVYGSASELARFISEAKYFQDMKNYRNALNIYDCVQARADTFDMGVLIEPMSDVYGVVAHNSNLNKLNTWLARKKSVRIGCRLNAPLFKLFGFLFSKKFNVHLTGMDTPADMLQKLIDHLNPSSVSHLKQQLAEHKKIMSTLEQLEQYKTICLADVTNEWIELNETDAFFPESVSYLTKYLSAKFSKNSPNGRIDMSTHQAAKGKASDIVLHFQSSLCPIETRLKSKLIWERCMLHVCLCIAPPPIERPSPFCASMYCCLADEEKCIAFVADTRAYEEYHHLVEIQNLTPAMMEKMLFPPPSEDLTVDVNADPDFLAQADEVSLKQALAMLGLTELPSTRGRLYMATYAKMKESETSEDENFPTKSELRRAREVCKAAFNLADPNAQA